MVTYYDFIAVPPSEEWLPTDIDGCVEWLRSDLAWQDAAKTVPCTNESLIWTGEDKSGNGHDVIQATEAKRPVYLTNQINGIYSAWQLDDVDDTMVTEESFVLDHPLTLFAVAKKYNSGQGYILSSKNWDVASILMSKDLTNWCMHSGWHINATVVTTNTWTILIGVYNGADSLFYVNGDDAITGNPYSFSDAGFRIGASIYDTYPMGGYLVEAGAYNSALGITDINLLRNYLNSQAQGTGYAIY